jgi:hypothetical protein
MPASPNSILNVRGTQKLMLQKTIDGLKKHEGTLSSLILGGTAYSTADLVAALQSRLDAANAVDTAYAAWRAAVRADYEARARTKDLLSDLRQTLLAAFRGSIETLADFGLVGRKPRVIAPETLVVAAQKARATRAARHTMGKRQREAIKGTLPAPSSEPGVSGAGPAAAG